jgi:hypothetical protein
MDHCLGNVVTLAALFLFFFFTGCVLVSATKLCEPFPHFTQCKFYGMTKGIDMVKIHKVNLLAGNYIIITSNLNDYSKTDAADLET